MEIVLLFKVAKFIEKLDPVLSFRVSRSIDLLSKHAYSLGMPISKSLGKGLFELRITGNDHARVFYCFYENKIYILHIILKKSQSLPTKDIQYARDMMKRVV